MPPRSRAALVGLRLAPLLRHLGRYPATVLLCCAAASCLDKDLQNPNAPDGARALTQDNVETLIAGAYRQWTQVHTWGGPVCMLSIAAGQHNTPWACCGGELYGRIPRVPTRNSAGASYSANLSHAWYKSYEAIWALQTALGRIDDGAVDLGTKGNLRARAYGRFVQGLAHGTLALLYDSAYVYDETLNTRDVVLEPYAAVMEAALDYLDEAIVLADMGLFTIPASWMSREVSAETLAQLAHSWRARFRANVARTPAERRAVEWDAVVADVAEAITEDWYLVSTCELQGFCEDGVAQMLYPSWQMQDNWIAGMADQSGAYQVWIKTPTHDKLPFLILTPDTRWPQGPDEATQLDNPGEYYSVNEGDTRLWSRPDRGTWRWSYYANTREPFASFARNFAGELPQVTVHEMKALAAEAAYYSGDMAAVAAFVNETRTRHGLQATAASGANTDCVPRLPSGACGGLWEMLKWEKRLETQFAGPLRIGWYFDGRGWGDLIQGTVLQFPVPYEEMKVLGREPYDYGGEGGMWGAPPDRYGFFTQTSDVATVTIVPADTVLPVGRSVQLTATALDVSGEPRPGKSFVWSSSEAGVATVDSSGLVMALAEGQAVIRAITEGVAGFATVTVTIEPPTVYSVIVAPDTVTLTAQGETAQLTATALDSTGGAIPGVAFTWSSSDENVATVNGTGIVTAVGSGTATVTVTAGSLSDSAIVTVQIPPLVVVTPQGVSLEGAGATYTLSAEAWDANGKILAPTIVWSSLNPNVATVDGGGTVTALAAGQVTIAAAVDGGVGYALVTASVPGGSPVTVWHADSVAIHSYLAVWGSSATNVFVAGSHTEILAYDGMSWTAMTTWRNSLWDLWGTGSGNVFAVGTQGWIYRYDGVDWTSMVSGTGYGIIGVWGTSPADVFAVGTYGQVLHYDGDEWHWVIRPANWDDPNLSDVWGTSPTNVFAVGEAGTIRHFDGATWTSQGSATGNDLNAVWGTSPQDIFTVGDGGTILHYDGAQWTSVTSGTSENLLGIWGTSSADVFVVGAAGTLRHYDGASWTSVAVGTTEMLIDIWGTSSGSIFTVGGNGTILRGERE